MKKHIFLLVIIVLLLIFILCGCSQADASPCFAYKAEEIGSPFSKHYSNNIVRTPWDMIIFENKLFIGSGDYDKNSGPCLIASYDITTEDWSTYTLPDEQIESFAIIDGKLMAPGIDPMDDWVLGNYYVYEDSAWQTIRSIPYGIHTFQIIEFQNKMFAALGTEKGHFPVSMSSDGGQSFTEVRFTKNGSLCPVEDSQNDRVYNMFIIKSKLYAIRFSGGAYEVFVFLDGQFEFVYQWMYDIIIPDVEPFSQKCGFSASITYNDVYYFSTGYLFKTVDGENIKYVALDKERYVIDLYENNNILYALAIQKNIDGSYNSAIYRITGDNTHLLFEVCGNTYAQSFAVDNDIYYLGFGYDKIDPEQGGKIIKYTYKGDLQ